VLLGISWLSWLICALSIASAIALAWNVDPQVMAGKVRLVASALATIVAFLVLVNGARSGRRIAALEAGRYPRIKPDAWRRIAKRVGLETAQMVTIDGEGGDDIREVAAGLLSALQEARWDVREMRLGGTLWGAGTGILIAHAAAAEVAATALIDALKAEGLPAASAGECTTGFPVHVAFRRP